MTTVGNLSPPFRAVFLLALFLLCLICVYGIPPMFSERNKKSKLIIVIAAFLAGFLELLFLYDYREMVRDPHPLLPLQEVFLKMPVWLLTVEILLTGALMWVIIRDDQRRRRENLSVSSIKEGIDNLPVALCFAAVNGQIMLANHQMQRIYRILKGEPLQNAEDLWEVLQSGNTVTEVRIFGDALNPEVELPDHTIWRFQKRLCTERENLIWEIRASETTELHEVEEELRQETAALQQVHERLKRYGNDVEEVTREKEHLETKVRFHRELGQALLATRYYLKNKESDPSVILEQWKSRISVIKAGDSEHVLDNSLMTLRKNAQMAGISLSISGRIPKQEQLEQLLYAAAAEALTNAVRHAEATRLTMKIRREKGKLKASFKNNGKQPAGAITEGGGLSSLRRRVEECGGAMTIIWEPEYQLILELPEEGAV